MMAAAQAQKPKDSDWAVRCFKQDVCILQTGLLNQQRQTIAVLALRKNEADVLVAELRTPTGLLISKGIKATVGSLQFRPTLITCLEKACLSSFDMTKDVRRAFEGSKSLKVSFTDALSGTEVELPFSLRGFNAQLKEFLARKTAR